MQSCSYTFTGASIPLAMKTVSVQLFENNAAFVVPNLTVQLTEAFRDRIRNQSSLDVIKSEGDGNFEGRITDYSNKPISVQTSEQSSRGQERLTITISVKYTSSLDPKSSFETTFTRFADYTLTAGTFQAQEQELIKKIIVQLTEDIFNKAFANWK
ncbi:MAG: hypothetical protein JWN56_2050 [Sphingobacteriales bacterium]|nr:hypothetical protein [Sphingobacteriales bacterium]